MCELGASVAEGRGAHPDHGEKEGHRTEDRVYWCGACSLFGDVQAIDGHIQRGDDLALALLLL